MPEGAKNANNSNTALAYYNVVSHNLLDSCNAKRRKMKYLWFIITLPVFLMLGLTEWLSNPRKGFFYAMRSTYNKLILGEGKDIMQFCLYEQKTGKTGEQFALCHKHFYQMKIPEGFSLQNCYPYEDLPCKFCNNTMTEGKEEG